MMSLPSTDVHPVPVRTELTSPRSSEGMTAVIRVCGTRMATETRGGTRRGWRGAGSEPRGPGGAGAFRGAGARKDFAAASLKAMRLPIR